MCFKNLIRTFALPILAEYPILIFADQYSTGTHSINSKSGKLTKNVGHVSHLMRMIFTFTLSYSSPITVKNGTKHLELIRKTIPKCSLP